jgi:hypothetical protein
MLGGWSIFPWAHRWTRRRRLSGQPWWGLPMLTGTHRRGGPQPFAKRWRRGLNAVAASKV